MSKTIRVFGKPVSAMALSLILMSTIAVSAIAAFTAYWSQMKPISVDIIANFYMFDIYIDPECTTPLTGIDFGNVMQSNDVKNSVFRGEYYLKLDMLSTEIPDDLVIYWSADTSSEWAPDPSNPLVEFIVYHNGPSGEVWPEAEPLLWSAYLDPPPPDPPLGFPLVMAIGFELRVNDAGAEGNYDFNIVFESGIGMD